MSYQGFESPFSAVGHLRSELESKLHQKANSYELSETNRRMDSLEHSSMETRSELDGLRFELESAKEQIQRLTEMLECIEVKP